MQFLRSTPASFERINIPSDYFTPSTMPSGKPWPKITVVTPTYKRARLLEETINSVISQKYPNLEYIVIDGGMDSDTKVVLQKYQDHIAYCESGPDRGQSHALNKGFAHATGDILTWLNDDDTFEPDALYSIALAFDMHQCDIVAGVVRVERDGKLEAYHMASCATGRLKLQEILDLDGGWNAGRFFYQPEVAFTREIWERAGTAVDETLNYSMDYDLWVRFAALDAKIAIIGTPICKFLIHPGQKTLGAQNDNFKTELYTYVTRYKRNHDVSFLPTPKGNGLARICIVSDLGLQYGAGIAHRRLAEALRSAGHEVTTLRLLNEETALHIPTSARNIAKIVTAVKSISPDAVFFGNLHSTNISPLLAKEIAATFPTFLLTHDFWWITGHCPYPMAPENEAHICEESCPRWYKHPKTMPSKIPELFNAKLKLFTDHTGISIAANSNWSAEQYGSTLDKHNASIPIYQIRLGIATDVFYPRNKKSLQKKYHIDSSKFQIMISCSDIRDPRKSVFLILEALELLDRRDVSLIVVGSGELPVSKSTISINQVGVIDSEEILAECYGCADLHISASAAETFGQTLLEATACGIPVIAMAGSGTEDIVVNGYNGFLLTERAPRALAEAIAKIMDDPQLRASLSFWGPILAANEFSYFRSYYSLFRMFEDSNILAAYNCKRKIDFLPHTVKVVSDIVLGTDCSMTLQNSHQEQAHVRKKKGFLRRLMHKVPLYRRYREGRRERRNRKRSLR